MFKLSQIIPKQVQIAENNRETFKSLSKEKKKAIRLAHKELFAPPPTRIDGLPLMPEDLNAI